MASIFDKPFAPSLCSSPSTVSLSMLFNADDPILIHKSVHRRVEKFTDEPSKISAAAQNPPADDQNKKETWEKDPFIYVGEQLFKDEGEKTTESLKNYLKPQLRNVYTMKPTVESGHRAAALVDLAKLLHAKSDPYLDDAGKRAREGAMRIELGKKIMDEGESMLVKVLQDISRLVAIGRF